MRLCCCCWKPTNRYCNHTPNESTGPTHAHTHPRVSECVCFCVSREFVDPHAHSKSQQRQPHQKLLCNEEDDGLERKQSINQSSPSGPLSRAKQAKVRLQTPSPMGVLCVLKSALCVWLFKPHALCTPTHTHTPSVPLLLAALALERSRVRKTGTRK